MKDKPLKCIFKFQIQIRYILVWITFQAVHNHNGLIILIVVTKLSFSVLVNECKDCKEGYKLN